MIKLMAILISIASFSASAALISEMDRSRFITDTNQYNRLHYTFDGYSQGEDFTEPGIGVFYHGVGYRAGRIVNIGNNGYLGINDHLNHASAFNYHQTLVIDYFPNETVRGVGFTLLRPDIYGQEFDPNDIEIDFFGTHIDLPSFSFVGDYGGTFFGAYDLDDAYRNVKISFKNEVVMGWIDELFIIVESENFNRVNEPRTVWIFILGLILMALLRRLK